MGLSETLGQVMQSSILLIKTISQLSLTKGIDLCSISANSIFHYLTHKS
jgi:hypothetical protein